MVQQRMSTQIQSFGLSNKGCVRKNNEDFWGELPEKGFFVIADGMGGHRAGEVAAKEAVTMLCRRFDEILAIEQEENPTPKEIMQLFGLLIEQVNSHVYHMGIKNPRFKGMGTTLCATFCYQDTLIYGSVGDSRIYRFRNGKLECLTHDHSLLQELLDLGQIQTEDSSDFLYKNIITKAVGLAEHLEPSMQMSDIKEGDLILMCTDGLTDLLPDTTIEKIVASYLNRGSQNVEILANTLVQKALDQGGSDNVTVVVFTH